MPLTQLSRRHAVEERRSVQSVRRTKLTVFSNEGDEYMDTCRCLYCRQDVDSYVARNDIPHLLHRGHTMPTVILCHRCNAIWNTSPQETRDRIGEVLLEACDPIRPRRTHGDAIVERGCLPRFDMSCFLAH